MPTSRVGIFKLRHYLRLHPELEKEDVYEAAKYGAWLASERTSALT